MEDIDHYDIPVYNFPYDVEEDDEDTIQDNSELRVCNDKFELFTSPGYLYLRSVHDAVRYCRIRGGSRDQRRTGSGQDLPLGYRRGRQPKAFGLPELEKGPPEVRRSNLFFERLAITVGNQHALGRSQGADT